MGNLKNMSRDLVHGGGMMRMIAVSDVMVQIQIAFILVIGVIFVEVIVRQVHIM